MAAPESVIPLGDVATWVAALAAVAAVFAAVTVPWKIDANARRRSDSERETEAQCLATALYLEADTMVTAIILARMEADRIAKEDRLRSFTTRDHLRTAFRIEPSPVLASQSSRLWILGREVAPKLMELLAAIEFHNRTVDKGVNELGQMTTLPGETPPVVYPEEETLTLWRGQLDTIEKLMTAMRPLLKKISPADLPEYFGAKI